MTPAARAGAAIELLDEIIAAARSGGAAADTLIARYFKTRRYAGSPARLAPLQLPAAAGRIGAAVWRAGGPRPQSQAQKAGGERSYAPRVNSLPFSKWRQ